MARTLVIFQGGLGNQLFQLAAALSFGGRGVADATLLCDVNQRRVTPRSLEVEGLLALLKWPRFAIKSSPVESLYRPGVNKLGARFTEEVSPESGPS